MADRLPALRAALWALRAAGTARRQLRRDGLNRIELPEPPRVPENASRGVLAALRRRPATCLERALVLQRWYAAHGRPHDIVIGVAGTAESFEAHAWLEGEDPGRGYRELSRVPAP
jgi:hypothetical protein